MVYIESLSQNKNLTLQRSFAIARRLSYALNILQLAILSSRLKFFALTQLKKRLQALPFTTLCIKCAALYER